MKENAFSFIHVDVFAVCCPAVWWCLKMNISLVVLNPHGWHLYNLILVQSVPLNSQQEILLLVVPQSKRLQQKDPFDHKLLWDFCIIVGVYNKENMCFKKFDADVLQIFLSLLLFTL